MTGRLVGNVVRHVEETVPAVLLGAMVTLIVVDVMGRYVFSSPIRGAAELATAAFVWVIFLGGAAAMRRRLHVNIDVLVALLPARLQAAVYVVMHLVLAAGFLTVVPLAWTYATRNNRIMLFLNLPFRYILVVVAASFVLIAIHSVVAALGGIRGLARGTFALPEANQDFGVSEDTRPLFEPPTEAPPVAPSPPDDDVNTRERSFRE